MMAPQVVLLFITLGSFAFPRLGELGISQLVAVYAIILSFAKAIWFYSPVAKVSDR
jgi:hypothetical protein